ncbi:MAG TPA: OpgC domain-containing protein [Stellaceae bacterium]|nr:OpgC domain-containing protein [Stellaceae bacterium]
MEQAAAKAARDPRLDFFRGSAMFIIFIAHCRGNFLWDYIPARYGLSDAAEMFVFLSGMAASIAFGGTFIRQGWLIGTARILYRCWQLFVAHLGLFFTGAMLVAAATRWWDEDYIGANDLQSFFRDPAAGLVGLFTLTYVPHYFDILPLYMVVLAMVPGMMLLARINPALVPAVSVTLYAAAVTWGWNFPANADEQPVWYFNPFAWQLIFFTGFALRRGWVKVPLDSKPLFWGSVLVLLAGLSISLPSVFGRVPAIEALRLWIMAHSDKTNLDLLQYLHFLASAYVIVVLLKGREDILLSAPLRPFVKCGQQALSIFVSGMVLSFLGGMVFDHAGDGAAVQIAVNGACFGTLFGIAYGVAWIKSTPWKRPPARAVAPSVVVAPLERDGDIAPAQVAAAKLLT